VVVDDDVRASRQLRPPLSGLIYDSVLGVSSIDSRGGVNVARAALDTLPAFDEFTAVRVGAHVLAPLPTLLLDRRLPGRGLSYSGAVYRMVRNVRCKYGALWALGLMASVADFAQQRRNFQRVVDWYSRYVRVARQLFPEAVVLLPFCNPGGHAEGCARVDLNGAGIDWASQLSDAVGWFSHMAHVVYPSRRARITVTRGDALSQPVRERALALHPLGGGHLSTISTPPCAPQSTLRHLQEAAVTADVAAQGNSLLEDIALNQDAYVRSGVPWFSETTANPALVTPDGVARAPLLGIWAGLRTHDQHWIYFPPLHPLMVDQSLSSGGRWLASHSCTGADKALSARHPHGSPVGVCCEGNLCACWNASTCKYSLAQTRRILEIHDQHVTSRGRLNDLLPPALGELLAAQSAMHALNVRTGVPGLSFDHGSADPLLAVWHDAILAAFATCDGLFSLPASVSSRRGVRWACVLCVPAGMSPPCVLLDERLSPLFIPLHSGADAHGDGRSLVTRVAEALLGVSLEVVASRLQFVCDFDAAGEWAVLFHLSSLDLACRARLALPSDGASPVQVALSSVPPRCLLDECSEAVAPLALVPVSDYLSAVSRVSARLLTRVDTVLSIGCLGLFALHASRYQLVGLDITSVFASAGLASLVSTCSSASSVRPVFFAPSMRLEAARDVFRFQLLPVPSGGDAVRLPSDTGERSGGGTGGRALTTYPALAHLTDGMRAPLSASLDTVPLPSAENRRKNYIELRKRIVSSRAADEPAAFGLAGKRHPDSDTRQGDNSGFNVRTVDKAIVAVRILERADGCSDKALLISQGTRQLGLPAAVIFRAATEKSDAATLHSKELASITTELTTALKQLLPQGSFLDLALAKLQRSVKEEEPVHSSWVVASRDAHGQRGSTSVQPIRYDCRLWTVLVSADSSARDVQLQERMPGGTSDSWRITLPSADGQASTATVTDDSRTNLAPLLLCWLPSDVAAKHFRATGRSALAACFDSPAVCSALAFAADRGHGPSQGPALPRMHKGRKYVMQGGETEHERMRRENALLMAIADSGLEIAMRYVALRLRVSQQPWVDASYYDAYFDSIRQSGDNVELFNNVAPHAAAQPGFWVRQRPSGRNYCRWQVIRNVRRYPSFAHAVLSGDFPRSQLNGPPIAADATASQIERHFYGLHRARVLDLSRTQGHRVTQIASNWGSTLGRKDRVLCWELRPAPAHVQPPGGRFQVRRLDDPARRVDVRPAWRALARLVSMARMVSKRRRATRSIVCAVQAWRRIASAAASKAMCALGVFAAQGEPERAGAFRRFVQSFQAYQRGIVKSSVVRTEGECRATTWQVAFLFYLPATVTGERGSVWTHKRAVGGRNQEIYGAKDGLQPVCASARATDGYSFRAAARRACAQHGLPKSWTAAAFACLDADVAPHRVETRFKPHQLVVHNSWVVTLSPQDGLQVPYYWASTLAKVFGTSMRWRRVDDLPIAVSPYWTAVRGLFPQPLSTTPRMESAVESEVASADATPFSSLAEGPGIDNTALAAVVEETEGEGEMESSAEAESDLAAVPLTPPSNNTPPQQPVEPEESAGESVVPDCWEDLEDADAATVEPAATQASEVPSLGIGGTPSASN
jgi:hypothetical protein